VVVVVVSAAAVAADLGFSLPFAAAGGR